MEFQTGSQIRGQACRARSMRTAGTVRAFRHWRRKSLAAISGLVRLPLNESRNDLQLIAGSPPGTNKRTTKSRAILTFSALVWNGIYRLTGRSRIHSISRMLSSPRGTCCPVAVSFPQSHARWGGPLCSGERSSVFACAPASPQSWRSLTRPGAEVRPITSQPVEFCSVQLRQLLAEAPMRTSRPRCQSPRTACHPVHR